MRDRCYRGNDVLFTVNILVALVVGGGDVIVVVGGSSVALLVLASVLSWRLWCFVCVWVLLLWLLLLLLLIFCAVEMNTVTWRAVPFISSNLTI